MKEERSMKLVDEIEKSLPDDVTTSEVISVGVTLVIRALLIIPFFQRIAIVKKISSDIVSLSLTNND